MDQGTELQLDIGGTTGSVSALLLRPPDPWILYVLAHGAGAGMRHPFMAKIADALASKGIATLRYQFPYLEAGRRRPDPPAVLETTVRAVVAQAGEVVPGLPMIAGGKSLGGRMTSGAAAGDPLEGVRGLVFLGFPLHSPGQPGSGRAEHLRRVNLPLLFLQGTRDTFARLDLITAVCTDIGPQATLHIIPDADHSFGVPPRTGRTPGQVFDELADAIDGWARTLVGNPVRA
jgi:predicted alpha/beta-hydrolase family hydrolase